MDCMDDKLLEVNYWFLKPKVAFRVLNRLFDEIENYLISIFFLIYPVRNQTIYSTMRSEIIHPILNDNDWWNVWIFHRLKVKVLKFLFLKSVISRQLKGVQCGSLGYRRDDNKI